MKTILIQTANETVTVEVFKFIIISHFRIVLHWSHMHDDPVLVAAEPRSGRSIINPVLSKTGKPIKKSLIKSNELLAEQLAIEQIKQRFAQYPEEMILKAFENAPVINENEDI